MPIERIAEQNQKVATDDECRAALTRVVASKSFANSERLKNFLTYIVEQTIAGRGELIPGKTIAMDVYGRDPATNSKSDNIVRVDARRLRRSLDEYYATEGKNDPIRIVVDSGGYTPRMKVRNGSSLKMPVFWTGKILIGAATIMLVGGMLAAILFGIQRGQTPSKLDRQIVLERQALREKSPLALQAVNLADQARGFLFPLLAPDRQKIATEMFRQAILLDPDYFGGFAGTAQTLTTLSMLTPPGPGKDALLAEAVSMAEMATEKNPTHAWTQSATGWVALGARDYERAFEFSSRATKLSPNDGNVLDFHGVISIFSGHFEEARRISDPTRSSNSAKNRLANRNVFGLASFHLGFYEDTIVSLQRASELGDPISAPSLLYQAIAHQALGNSERALELQKELFATWPNFRPEVILPDFYQHQTHVDQILDLLRATGWKPSD